MSIRTYFENIADAIRTKVGNQNVLTPAQMPQAILNIPSGGNAVIEFLYSESLPNTYIQNGVPFSINACRLPNSSDLRKFLEDYATSVNIPQKTLTLDIFNGSVNNYLSSVEYLYSAEYSGYVYGKPLLDDISAVLLLDASQGSPSSGVLSQPITNFSAVLLQGIYRNTRNSQYNTTMLYVLPSVGGTYWAGMKDRNPSYDCNVTFVDAGNVSLSGNRSVIIWGLP